MMGDKNPMKRPEVVKSMVETTRKRGWYDVAGKRLKKLWKDGKVPSGYLSEKERKRSSERMKKNNPMKIKSVIKKQSNTQKRLIKEGKIVPFMCIPEGRAVMSAIATDKSLNDNPMNKYKGMTWEEIFGEEKGKKRREKYHKMFLGEKSAHFGKKPFFPKECFVKELGHKVRSNWEKTFCLRLKKQGISYKYEARSFLLNIDGKRINYWPDIKLSDNVFIEIKAGWLLEKESQFKKLNAFTIQHNKLLIIISEEPPKKKINNTIYFNYNEKDWKKEEFLKLI